MNRYQFKALWLLILALVFATCPQLRAQAGHADSSSTPGSVDGKAAVSTPEKDSADSADLQPGEDPENRLFKPFASHLAQDQKAFWTSPAHLTMKDWKWAGPFAGVTAGFIASDSWFAKQVPDKPNQLKRSLDISNYAVYSMIGVTGGSYLWGHFTGNDHLREAGFLSGEAAIDATAASYFLKAVTQRSRPLEDNGNGNFFSGGMSFPSEHTAVAWSVASIWAHEYPGPLSQLAAYGLASAITVTRVTSKQHFPADVVIGSALGWYFGRRVYRSHHDPELGGAAFGNFYEAEDTGGSQTRNPDYMSSPYIPMDSWIYPSLDRLIALGYVHNAFLGIRPWTRMACARLVEEAGEQLSNNDSPDEAAQIYRSLSREFVDELARLDGARNLGAKVDSVYTRMMNISGPPLRDGYHFGQTITNDFGRPFGDGANFISGASATAVVGPLSFYVRGEYQHAASVSPVSSSTLAAMASADFRSDFGPNFPPPPGYTVNTGSFDRFRLLEGSVNLTLSNVQISFGKQEAWLGPGDAGPLLFSDNAEPITMLRIDSTTPFHFPLLSRILGPARTEFFIGQLSGAQFVYQPPTLYGPGHVDPQPFIHGNKISFKPTQNLEFGIGVTALFGGPGLPFTFHNFFRTFYSHKANFADNPGKRFSEADVSYRIPGLRKWLSGYLDSLVTDEYSPIGSSRASINPGLYMPQVPKIPKLEIRAEGMNTSHPDAGACCVPGYTYFDARYISGYTNDGYMLANWIGRAGWGGQGWATYNFSPRSMLQVSYRSQHVDREFIEGGNLSDVTMKTNVTLRDKLTFSAMLQYEHWNFPAIAPTAQSNFTGSIQLTYWPKWGVR